MEYRQYQHQNQLTIAVLVVLVLVYVHLSCLGIVAGSMEGHELVPLPLHVVHLVSAERKDGGKQKKQKTWRNPERGRMGSWRRIN